MSSDTTYNGWTNYETWSVGLWIDNDPFLADEVRQLARGATNAYKLSQVIKEKILDEQPELGASLWSQLLQGALSEVNWQEIGEHYLPEDEDEDEDEDETEDSEPEEPQEPEDGDITTADHRTFFQHGKQILKLHIGTDCVGALLEYMDKEKFWPRCWFISDHGNAHPMEMNVENLDSMDASDVQRYADNKENSPRLREYAKLKARAMRARLAGNIASALQVEKVADRKFRALPPAYKW